MLALIIEQAPRFFTLNNMALLAQGAGITLLLTAIGCGVGGVAGFLIALLRASRSLWLFPLRWLSILYVELFRRIPFIVVLFIVLFSIQAVAPRANQFIIAAIAICLVSTAFLSEIIRAGFDSVPRQQIEAAETLNFPRWLTVRRVVLPQAWKVILPPAIAFVVMFIKDTALASQMGVIELMFVGRTLNNRGFSSFMVFGTVLLIYFAISWPLARLGRHPAGLGHLARDLVLAACRQLGEPPGNGFIRLGLKLAEGEQLHLAHVFIHADPLGERGVDIHRLLGDAPPFGRVLDMVQRAHIV